MHQRAKSRIHNAGPMELRYNYGRKSENDQRVISLTVVAVVPASRSASSLLSTRRISATQCRYLARLISSMYGSPCANRYTFQCNSLYLTRKSDREFRDFKKEIHGSIDREDRRYRWYLISRNATSIDKFNIEAGIAKRNVIMPFDGDA